jgi:mycothiol synthase
MSVRPATRDDLPAIADLFVTLDEAKNGRRSRVSVEALDSWLQDVAFETNTWLIEGNGELLAATFAHLHGDRGNSAGVVRPTAEGRGLGSRLIELVEARMTEEGARRVQSWALARDTQAMELFARRGYREVRRFWEMEIELDRDPPKPGVTVAPFREEDAEAFYAALDEAFSDHWEHEPVPFEQWWSRQRRRANFDPSLWFLIRDGAEVTAVVRNEVRPDEGHVGALGVRRQWRGRGHGKALLFHSFREFRRRGLARASLGVDAANPTGATKLYESVGMHVEQENVVWEKLLA